jgi:hypothetical protein
LHFNPTHRVTWHDHNRREPQNGVGGGVLFDPETMDWCLCIYEAPLPKPVGSANTLSASDRPSVRRH